MKLTNFEKKKIKLLTNEHQKSYQNAKICYDCEEKFDYKHTNDKKHFKVILEVLHIAYIYIYIYILYIYIYIYIKV